MEKLIPALNSFDDVLRNFFCGSSLLLFWCVFYGIKPIDLLEYLASEKLSLAAIVLLAVVLGTFTHALWRGLLYPPLAYLARSCASWVAFGASNGRNIKHSCWCWGLITAFCNLIGIVFFGPQWDRTLNREEINRIGIQEWSPTLSNHLTRWASWTHMLYCAGLSGVLAWASKNYLLVKSANGTCHLGHQYNSVMVWLMILFLFLSGFLSDVRRRVMELQIHKDSPDQTNPSTPPGSA